jgi:arsenite-transporting ATPase
MRILLYTGKGGVGKTSVSAATAVRCAELGYRTIAISTDSAHSLADSFDVNLGSNPTQIADNLWGQEIDVLRQTEKHLGTLQRYMASVFTWRGLDRIVAEEMAIFPGLDELTSLIQVVHLYESQEYDVVVMDCAPTGATLQLLTMPEIGRWYLEKILPLEKKLFAIGRPLLRSITDLPIPEQEIVNALQTLLHHLERMQALLTDPQLTSTRLVLNPEKMVIKETQRAYMYLSLYGYATDALVCNRILPSEGTGAYFQEWHAIQSQYRQIISESFGLLPILDVPLFDREVVGLDMLRRMATSLFAGRDPTEQFYTGPTQQILEHEDGYTLQIPLPLSKGRIQLNRTASDEVMVQIGNRKRILSLPHTLAAMQLQGAHHDDNTLYIDFKWDAAQQPATQVPIPSGRPVQERS